MSDVAVGEVVHVRLRALDGDRVVFDGVAAALVVDVVEHDTGLCELALLLPARYLAAIPGDEEPLTRVHLRRGTRDDGPENDTWYRPG